MLRKQFLLLLLGRMGKDLALSPQKLRNDFQIFDNKPTLLSLAIRLAFEKDLSPEELVAKPSHKESVLDQPIQKVPIQLLYLHVC